MMRQNDDETLEAYLQRVLNIAMDGFKASDNNTAQQLATEAFLRGCKYKEAAALVFSEAPQTIQEACKKVKTLLANRKAIFGTKVTFQEKAFTLQEEKRVSGIERKVDSLTDIFRRPSPSPYMDNRTRPRYSPPPYRDSWNSGQFSPRQSSPSYNRGCPPRDSGGGNFGDAEYRGRSPIRRPTVGPHQGPYNRYRSPSPQRREPTQPYRSSTYGGQYASQQGPYTQDRQPQPYRPSQNYGGQYTPQQGQYTNRPNQIYLNVGSSPERSFDKNMSYQGSQQTSKDQYIYRQRNVELPDKGGGLSPERPIKQVLNLEGLVVPATDFQSGRVRVASVTSWRYHYQAREI